MSCELICDAEQLKFLFLIFGLKITNMTTCGITINCCNQHCYIHVVSKLQEKYSGKLDVTHNGIAKMFANFQRAFCSK